MTKLLLFTLFLGFQVAFGQNIEGQWNGVLSIQGTQLRLVFNITKKDEIYTATMDSPDQGAKGIPVTSTTLDGNKLTIIAENMKLKYEGKVESEAKIIGVFSQGTFKTDMELSREKIEPKKVLRPQDPVKPYSYYTEDVKFENKTDNVTLEGTLTLPKKDGKFPIVVLISGSGPQNRDEELLNHRPFLVIADYLTKNGIGVLRYDDRGTAESTGDFKVATSNDFAKDVEAAVAYLKTRNDADATKIGLIGHSEGGLIAPIVASNNNDVSFIVLLAGPGIPGRKLLPIQSRLIQIANGESEKEAKKTEKINTKLFKMVQNAKTPQIAEENLKKELSKIYKNAPEKEKSKIGSEAEFIDAQLKVVLSPWMLNFLKFDPRKTLVKVKCPVLAINGEKDLQVPSKINLDAINAALKKGGNKDFKTLELPNLNHLFQESKTGAPTEYSKIEQTFAPEALEIISNWILERVK